MFVGLTRAGWSSVFAETTARTGQIITDLGVMRNFGSHQAIGFTWFFSLRDEELSTGPAVRYRQWLNGRQSLDFGLGTMIAPLGEQYGDFRRGSVLGLIKYNPAPWFAVAIRSEVLRRTDCAMPESGYGCGPFPPGQEARARESGKQLRTASTSSILAGIELSEKPGATMSTIWLGAVGLITLLLAATGGS